MTRNLTLLLITACLVCTQIAPASAAAPKKSSKKSTPATQEAADGFNILSIIPSQGEPGKRINLMGTGFTAGTSAWLGTIAVPATVYNSQQIEFDIPRLEPGLYALYLKRPDGTVSKTYSFPVIAPKPVISSLIPETVYACATDRERAVHVSGKNFQEGSSVLFDGAAIRSIYSSPEALSFTAPPNIQGGQHNIQVKNPDDSTSTLLAFFIDVKPIVHGVTIGEDRVNYYDLVIEGHNFLQGSTVIVDGRQVYNGTDRDRIRYVNCNRIIYERYPYDRTPKNLRIQVINPPNEESAVITVTAP